MTVLHPCTKRKSYLVSKLNSFNSQWDVLLIIGEHERELKLRYGYVQVAIYLQDRRHGLFCFFSNFTKKKQLKLRVFLLKIIMA